MAEWDLNTARVSLRTLLADNAGDKFEFKLPLYPVPDGVTRLFSLGRTQVVEGTLGVFLNGVQVAPSGYETSLLNGMVELADAPAASGDLKASFAYRWFTDDQLATFLESGHQMMGFETLGAVTPVAIRPIALDFACYHAYMHQAALAAEEIVVTAGGYEAHQSRSHPNWREMARMVFEKAQSKLKLYLETALGQEAPALAMTAYRLINYQGP